MLHGDGSCPAMHAFSALPPGLLVSHPFTSLDVVVVNMIQHVACVGAGFVGETPLLDRILR